MLGRIAKRLAGQAASQLVANARSQHSSAKTHAPESPELGALFAMRLEASPTWDRMDLSTPCRVGKMQAMAGRLGSRFCVAAIGGVGRKAAIRSVAQLLELKPKMILSAGLAGALTTDLRQGDVVIADSVCTTDKQTWTLEQSQQLAGSAKSGGDGADEATFRRGRLVTTEHFVGQSKDRHELAQQHDAVICDMDTAWIAKSCDEAGVPLICVRVVVDEVDDEVPAEIATLRQQSSSASRLGAAAGTLFRSPGRAMDLWKLRQSAADAAVRLAEALVDLLK